MTGIHVGELMEIVLPRLFLHFIEVNAPAIDTDRCPVFIRSVWIPKEMSCSEVRSPQARRYVRPYSGFFRYEAGRLGRSRRKHHRSGTEYDIHSRTNAADLSMLDNQFLNHILPDG